MIKSGKNEIAKRLNNVSSRVYTFNWKIKMRKYGSDIKKGTVENNEDV